MSAIEDTSPYNWSTAPPPTIHSVSTTIGDQAHLQQGYGEDQIYTSEPFANGHLGNSYQDFQAASTLFNNVNNGQLVPTNDPSYDPQRPTQFHTNPQWQGPNSMGPRPLPMVATSQGQLDEQLAAILPNHSENGSIDASLAAQFSRVSGQLAQAQAEVRTHGGQRASLKRTYTYGTDNSFNPSGFVVSSPHETEDAVTKRLVHRVHSGVEPATKDESSTEKPSASNSQLPLPIAIVPLESDDEGQPENNSPGDEQEQPVAKRHKAKQSSPIRIKTENSRESAEPRSAKAGKKSREGDSKGRKRSTNGQKPPRENLTDAQKRTNHIHSEQKRRTIIREGFEDLHELVPGLQNGGLSKSVVLHETANFVEKLVADNERLAELIRAAQAARNGG